MPRRAAIVTQADIARVVRAMQSAGYTVRVVMRDDGAVVVEPTAAQAPSPAEEQDLAPRKPVVLL